LAKLLAAKIKSAGLNVTTAAKKAGISFPSFHAAMIGKSVPNARSVDKYAAFLGITAPEVMTAAGKKPAKAKSAKPGRRGRPPGSKNKKSKGGRPAAAGPSVDTRALSAALTAAAATLAKLAKAVRKAK
jgi:hypothetical protein